MIALVCTGPLSMGPFYLFRFATNVLLSVSLYRKVKVINRINTYVIKFVMADLWCSTCGCFGIINEKQLLGIGLAESFLERPGVVILSQ